MQKQFQIIFTGKFKSRFNKRSSAAQLALIIDSSPEDALEILHSRKEVVLFEQVNQSKVSNLISNLEQIGLEVKSVDKSNQSNRGFSNKNTTSEQVVSVKKLSKSYKRFIVVYAILSSISLIGFLIYILISGQSEPYGRMTLTDFAGYSQEEICLGLESCHVAVDDQSDDCYEKTIGNFEDWDSLTEQEKELDIIKDSHDFLNCFIYEKTNKKVFPEPIALRADLIESCLYLSTYECLKIAGTQFDSCVDKFNMKSLLLDNSQDLVDIKSNHSELFKNYYSCYLDTNGKSLFESVLFMLH